MAELVSGVWENYRNLLIALFFLLLVFLTLFWESRKNRDTLDYLEESADILLRHNGYDPKLVKLQAKRKNRNQL